MTHLPSRAELEAIRAGYDPDPAGSGKSEHALHHFHRLVLGAHAGAAPA